MADTSGLEPEQYDLRVRISPRVFYIDIYSTNPEFQHTPFEAGG